ncbi:MAG: hypothetical protein NVS3B21_31540 [Acidimicrobiales bacterium]
MCMNCVSRSEALVAQVGLVAALLRGPVHRSLADFGLVAPPDPIKRDVRTVQFLRALELDPVEILGPEVVAGAEQWVPQRAPALRWRLPIVSQRRLAPQ